MKKIFAFAVPVALSLGACTRIQIPGTQIIPVVLAQPGVEVSIYNQCTNEPGRVDMRTRGDIPVMPAEPTIVAESRGPFEGNTYNLNFTYKVFKNGTFVGTVARSFYIQGAITRYTWIIGGNSSGGGSNIYVDHLQGVC